MTAQRSDCYKYKGKEYSLVAISKALDFNPMNYGLIPSGRCTACWRGYWCDFEVKDSGLELQNLYINTKDQVYPDFQGVKVSPIEYVDCTCLRFVDGKAIEEPSKTEKHMGHREYKDIGLFINYTGKILVGNNFIRKYYIHMGFQRAYAYEKLIEFEFEEGKLINIVDHSRMAKKMRDELDATCSDLAHPDFDSIPKFVIDSFSTEYSVKAWWLT